MMGKEEGRKKRKEDDREALDYAKFAEFALHIIIASRSFSTQMRIPGSSVSVQRTANRKRHIRLSHVQLANVQEQPEKLL